MIRLANISLIALLSIMMACSRQDSTEAISVDPPASTDTTHFTEQTTGVTFQKVNNPKVVTDYVLQIPATYNQKKTVKWPLIIFLHGIGERGKDLNMVKRVGLAAKAAKDPDFPFIVVSPQCAPDGWWDAPSLNALYDDVMKRFNVDADRVYLTGLSMGGYGTWDWGTYSPEKFAAIVPICGMGTTSRACMLKTVPVWAFHNVDDPTVSVQGSRDMVKAIKDCGGTLVKYTENATGGHDAWTKAYNDPALYDWLKAQKK